MKDLGKFTLRIAILFVILVIVDVLVGMVFSSFRDVAYSHNKYSDCMVPEFASKDLDAQIVIVGASDAKHSYIPSMITDSTGLSCYNLGRDGSFTVYQLCLINLIAEHYTPKVIVWEIMEDCLSYDIPSDREYQSMKNLYPYYAENKFIRNVIDDMETFQPVKMRSQMLTNNSLLMEYVNSIRQNSSSDGYYPLPVSGYRYPEKAIETGYPFKAPRKEQLIKETIDLCQAKGIKIVFASAPNYSDNALKYSDCYRRLQQIAAENDIPFIDCTNMGVRFDDNTLYKDVAHLNDNGSRKYMSYFIPFLLKSI